MGKCEVQSCWVMRYCWFCPLQVYCIFVLQWFIFSFVQLIYRVTIVYNACFSSIKNVVFVRSIIWVGRTLMPTTHGLKVGRHQSVKIKLADIWPACMSPSLTQASGLASYCQISVLKNQQPTGSPSVCSANATEHWRECSGVGCRRPLWEHNGLAGEKAISVYQA